MGNDNHVVVSHKLCGIQGRVGGRVVVMEQCGACSNFLLRSHGKLHNYTIGVCELVDCSATVFVDEFLNFFNIFCLSAGDWSL
jgi:hypothetical protein